MRRYFIKVSNKARNPVMNFKLKLLFPNLSFGKIYISQKQVMKHGKPKELNSWKNLPVSSNGRSLTLFQRLVNIKIRISDYCSSLHSKCSLILAGKIFNYLRSTECLHIRNQSILPLFSCCIFLLLSFLTIFSAKTQWEISTAKLDAKMHPL